MPKKNSVIKPFYEFFQNKDAGSMTELYHPKATFKDPVFGSLNAHEVQAMWHMLIERGGENLQIDFEIIHETARKGQATWIAQYHFGKKKRKIRNSIQSAFVFKEGKIIKQHDHFDFYKWTRMAFGPIGILLGWTKWFQGKVKAKTQKALKQYMLKNAQTNGSTSIPDRQVPIS